MNEKDFYVEIIKVIEEMGYLIFDDEEDIDLSEYIVDSIQFISFIVALEDRFSIELSDDFYTYEILKSAKGLSNKLFDFCNG